MKKTINSILLLTLILSCNFIQTISVFANEIGPIQPLKQEQTS